MSGYVDAGRLRAPTPDPTVPLAIIATVLALCLGALLAIAGGAMAMLAVAGGLLVLATLVRPVVGLYSAMLFALAGNIHLNNANAAAGDRLFTSIPEVGVNLAPTEIVLICAMVGLAVRIIFDDDVPFRPGALLLPIGLFIVAIAIASVIGIGRGADTAVLRQEVRGLVLVPMLYLLFTHFVARQDQIARLMWVFVVGANVMAAESIYRYFTQVRTGYSLDISESLAFAHENSLLCAAAIILLMGRLVWTRNVVGEWKSGALLVLPLAAMLVMHRRAGMVALDGGAALLCLVLLREKTRTFLTASDNQTVVFIRVAQGESARFAENTRLGELELSGLKPGTRGEVKILVTFELDADGILNVRAKDKDTSRETQATMRLLGTANDAADEAAMAERQSRHVVA